MNIRLPFGAETVPIDVPDNWINGRCYRSFRFEEADDPEIALVNALEEPIGVPSFPAVVAGKADAVVAVDSASWDALAPALPSFLSELQEQSRIPARNITVLFTNSVWAPFDETFLEMAVPEEIRSQYTVALHSPRDAAGMRDLGRTGDGVPLKINSTYANASLKILFGVVRPDSIMGFHGGRSLVLPGLASEESSRAFYRYELLSRKGMGYGVIRDNPLHIAASEALMAAGCDFCVSAITAPNERIAEIVAGDGLQSTMAAIAKVRDKMRVTLKEPMDIAIASGGGAPWDGTLYRVFDAISATLPVLKENGTILVCAKMTGGFGPKPLESLLLNCRTPTGFERRFKTGTNFVPGQWVAQRMFEIMRRNEVIVYTGGAIKDDALWEAGLTPTQNMQDAVEVAMQGHGQRCKICALPDGPFSLASFGGE